MRFRGLVALCMVFCLTTAQTSPADAVFWRAFDLEMGSNGTRDVPGAIQLYQQGVRQGHGPSMVRLGYLMQLGTAMPRDWPDAFALYKQAAETGDLEGQFMYAIAHAQGVGAPKNPVLARQLFLPPADAGHQFAQYMLGCMTAIGDGGPKREAAARRWLDKAASGRDPAVATRAAELRDKIDKNLFAADNSSRVAVMGLAAFIIVGGVLAGGSGGPADGGGGMNTPSGGGMSSGSGNAAPHRPLATPMNGDITRSMHGIDRMGLGRPVNIR